MTHEELLAKIDSWFELVDRAELHNGTHVADKLLYLQGVTNFNKALRAVVELHSVQPTTIPGDPKCDVCSGLDWCDWPCQTIQVIQKELQ